MLIFTYFSGIWNQRSYLGALAQIWILPNIIALAVIPAVSNQWVRFAIVTVLLSWPSRKSCAHGHGSDLTNVSSPCYASGMV